jgi:hypothetical protein
LFAAVLSLTAVTTALVLSTRSDRPADVALLFDTDLSVIARMLVDGADRAAEESGIEVQFRTPVNDVTLGHAADEGTPLILPRRSRRRGPPRRAPGPALRDPRLPG